MIGVEWGRRKVLGEKGVGSLVILGFLVEGRGLDFVLSVVGSRLRVLYEEVILFRLYFKDFGIWVENRLRRVSG